MTKPEGRKSRWTVLLNKFEKRLFEPATAIQIILLFQIRNAPFSLSSLLPETTVIKKTRKSEKFILNYNFVLVFSKMNYFFIIQLTVGDGSKLCSRKMLRLPQHSAAGDDNKTVFSGSSLVTLKKTSTTADRSVATGSKKNPDITHMEIFILLQ